MWSVPHGQARWSSVGSDDKSGESSVTPPARGMHGQIVEELGQRIGEGTLQPGQLLVPDAICFEFAASRPVVREALRVLQAKGLVLARPKAGTFVRDVDNWNLLDRDVILWRMRGPARDEQFADLLALRASVEPMAAYEGAKNASVEQVRSLRLCLSAMEVAYGERDQVSFTEHDVQFHETLLECSGHRLLRQLAGAIGAALSATQMLHLLPQELAQGTIESHLAIVNAIASGDSIGAEGASRELIADTRAELEMMLTADGNLE
jgi:DNA-binding FadR family transcriptional regulator